MDERILSKLYEPFKLQERRGVGNKVFKYVPSEDIVDRMNKVFLGSWSTDVRKKEIIEDQILICVRVYVSDPIDGKEYWHDGYASHPIARYTSGMNNGKPIDIGNSFKSAMSKAIKTAVSKWGVALYLENEDAGDTPFAFGDTVRTDSPSIPDVPKPAGPIAGPPEFDMPSPVKTGSKLEIPSSPFDIPTTAVSTSRPQAIPEPVVEKPFVQSSPFDIPPITNAGTGPAAPGAPAFANIENTATPDFVTSDTTLGEICTPVQQVAINTIMESQEVSFAELLKRVLVREDNLPPSLDKLSYTDAVKIIQYGNELSKV